MTAVVSAPRVRTLRSALGVCLAATMLLAFPPPPSRGAATLPSAVDQVRAAPAVRSLAPTASATASARIRVLIKVPRRPASGQVARIRLGTRTTSTSGYAAVVTVDSAGRVTVQHMRRLAGEWAPLGRPRSVLRGVRSGALVLAETEILEVAGRTRLRTKVAKPGLLARARSTVSWDGRADRPTGAGTSTIGVSATGSAVRPTVIALGVPQPSQGSAVPADLPASPDPGMGAWAATAVRVVDGDTLEVVLDADPTGRLVHIRNAGIQAAERGQCGAARATATMATLAPPGTRLLLTARNASSTSADGTGRQRPLRYIYALHSGMWVDIQLALLQRGDVLFYPFPTEHGHAREYRAAMERAAAERRGMFEDTCGSSAASWSAIWVNFDGDGNESTNPNAEYVRVLNRSAETQDLSGWRIRTGSPRAKVLPAGTRLAPGAVLTLHVGKGVDVPSRGVFHWGSATPQFPNTLEGSDGRRLPDPPGGVAYLFDSRGALRAHTTYPCATCGEHPLRGAVALAAFPTGLDERVMVRNTSGARIDLSYQVLQVRGSTYEILPGTVLEPGESLTVRMRSGLSTRLSQFWGRQATYSLPDGAGEVRLRDARDTEAACRAWGSGSC